MRIGVTERGDAGIDLSWKDKLDTVNAAILITKNITPGFTEAVMDAYDAGCKFVIHAGCTGYGSTIIEPNVPDYKTQIEALRHLTQDLGFPAERCVLRMDPLIPTYGMLAHPETALEHACNVLDMEKMRVRISVIDDYRHVKQRFRDTGMVTIYDGDRFYANAAEMKLVSEFCGKFPDITFETCAEKFLQGDNIKRSGCVSYDDLRILGIDYEFECKFNPQNRSGCLCLQGKTELLEHKKQCPHKCLYCYWQTDHK